MDKIPSPTLRDEGESRDQIRPEERSFIRPIDDGRSRQRTGDAAINPYEVSDLKRMLAPTNGDPKKGNINNETDLEWKAYETYGKVNHTHLVAHEDQGWRPVPHSMFPGRFAPAGTEGSVRVNDMILMERPMRLTVQARQEDYARATRATQMNNQRMGEAPEGEAPRTKPVVRSSRETIEIPD